MKYLVYEIGKSPQKDDQPFEKVTMDGLSLLIDDGVYRFYPSESFHWPIVVYPISHFWLLREG